VAVAQKLTEQDYIEFVLSHPEGQWELHDGVLVEKPGMSWRHLNSITQLILDIGPQLDENEHRVFIESRVRRPEATIFLPDVAIVPTAYGEAIFDDPGMAVFPGPLPLVVEVWSPSTGDYDVDTKIPVYMQRGDLEIWRLHPFEQTLTRWVRRPDGTYEETVHHGGVLSLVALPTVTVDLDRLWLP
jgi:Uma2 family endonuclease